MSLIRIGIKLDGYVNYSFTVNGVERDGWDKTFRIKNVKSLWYMVDYLSSVRDHERYLKNQLKKKFGSN